MIPRALFWSFFFFFSSRRRHTRYWRDWEFRRVLFRSGFGSQEAAYSSGLSEATSGLGRVWFTGGLSQTANLLLGWSSSHGQATGQRKVSHGCPKMNFCCSQVLKVFILASATFSSTRQRESPSTLGRPR